ncbi:vWA domain-containing protein [Persicimonas caeni]|nr:vWA domain-containing protein [Persicimonas caeni]
MRRKANTKIFWFSLVAAFLVVSPALGWNFDDGTCAPAAGFETGVAEPPQSMIMLDRSGSMDNPSQTCGGDICSFDGSIDGRTYVGYEYVCDGCTDALMCETMLSDYLSGSGSTYTINSTAYLGWRSCDGVQSLWEAAVAAIDAITFDLTQALPDDVRFGLGLFHGTGATIHLEAAEDRHPDIMAVLNNTSPGGGTPMATAIDTAHLSTTIQSAPTGAAGILVTDGEPDNARSAVIQAACEHRATAPLYVIGFGGGTDKAFNDVLAGAGGTGSCTNGGDPCASGTYQYDATYWTGKCTGSYQAENQTEFQNALNQISNQIACTFDISALATDPANPEWDDPNQGCANYDCLQIQLNGAVNQRIYHTSSTNAPVGWAWASTNHTQIRLLDMADGAADDYCQKLKSGYLSDPDENDISITRACMCTQTAGGNCSAGDMVPPPGACDCQVGNWVCVQGTDVCEPREPCVNDNGNPADKTGEGDACTVGVGECANTGTIQCIDGLPECDAVAGTPQPEVCDGLDNDCGGAADEAIGADDNTPGGLDIGGLCHVDCVGGACADEQLMISNEVNRCNLGEFLCDSGTPACAPFGAMPEVCNGLDDDCNGSVDNLSTSWDLVVDENGDPYTLPSEYAAAACYERDVCSCPNGARDDIEGTDFSSYVAGWANGSNPPDPTCVCGEGLRP